MCISYFQCSLWTTMMTIPFAVIGSFVAIRSMIGMPPSIMGNKLPKLFNGKRYQLCAMPINHFGEKLRWCLDLIKAPYEESNVAGIMTIFLRGRTVPWLVDRQSRSLLGNSDEALFFLSAVHVPTIPDREERDRAIRLLQRDTDTVRMNINIFILGKC